MNGQPLLTVEGLSMRFGGLLAVNNVGLTLNQGEIVSLIGPNGAGKTTIFNCLTGFYRPTGGTIKLRERHLEGLPGQMIARMGVIRTFQHVRLFREMTVIENLLVAQHQHLKSGIFCGFAENPRFSPGGSGCTGASGNLAGAGRAISAGEPSGREFSLRSATTAGNRPLHGDTPRVIDAG